MAIVKTDDRTFVRDTTSHALLNTDQHALARSRSERAARDRATRLTKEVADLRSQVIQLTAVVEKLLAKE